MCACVQRDAPDVCDDDGIARAMLSFHIANMIVFGCIFCPLPCATFVRKEVHRAEHKRLLLKQ